LLHVLIIDNNRWHIDYDLQTLVKISTLYPSKLNRWSISWFVLIAPLSLDESISNISSRLVVVFHKWPNVFINPFIKEYTIFPFNLPIGNLLKLFILVVINVIIWIYITNHPLLFHIFSIIITCIKNINDLLSYIHIYNIYYNDYYFCLKLIKIFPLIYIYYSRHFIQKI